MSWEPGYVPGLPMAPGPLPGRVKGDRATGRGRVVGDDSVHPEIQELGGGFGFVDRVAPDREAPSVGAADRVPVHLTVPDRDAGTQRLDLLEPGGIQRLLRVRELPTAAFGGGTERTQDLPGFELMELAEVLPVEGLDDDPIDEVALAEQADEGGGVAVFAFDEGDAPGLDEREGAVEGGEGLTGERRLEPGADVECGEVGGGAGGHLDALRVPALRGVRGAVERPVMDHDRGAVGAVVVIEFDEVDPGIEGSLEGDERVLGGDGGVAAVPDDEGTAGGEELLGREGGRRGVHGSEEGKRGQQERGGAGESTTESGGDVARHGGRRGFKDYALGP